MRLPAAEQFNIEQLGEPKFASPLRARALQFAQERDRVLATSIARHVLEQSRGGGEPASFEVAGPRPNLFFSPADAGCGIVTCGGLCPGINNVIRSLVRTLYYAYGVRRIWGFRYGMAGMIADLGYEPVEMTPNVVGDIHEYGGTILGTSRGPQELDAIVDTLERLDIQALFMIGGDGTLRGASALCDVIAERGLKISVIGIPKTIDNDLDWIDRSFGFRTAVQEAQRAVKAAHNEARAVRCGVTIVPLMGRHSGFIAAEAALSNADVNFCLVPEVPFALAGDRGFLSRLEQRLEARDHAVIVVAEGAGQDLIEAAGEPERDPSGNIRLEDIGQFLRDRIDAHFAAVGKPVKLRVIDPSYQIRSLPANAHDASFCLALGHHAVHAAMAGRTRMLTGFWNHRFTHVPIDLAVARRKQLDPEGWRWQLVLETTGQPARMIGE